MSNRTNEVNLMPEKLLGAPKCTKTHSESTRQGVSHVATSQSSAWRHKCAACAYEAGIAEGKRQTLAQGEKER